MPRPSDYRTIVRERRDPRLGVASKSWRAAPRRSGPCAPTRSPALPCPLRARRNPGGRTRRGRCRSVLLTVVGSGGGLGKEVDRLGDNLYTVALGAVLVGPLGVVKTALDRDL